MSPIRREILREIRIQANPSPDKLGAGGVDSGPPLNRHMISVPCRIRGVDPAIAIRSLCLLDWPALACRSESGDRRKSTEKTHLSRLWATLSGMHEEGGDSPLFRIIYNIVP